MDFKKEFENDDLLDKEREKCKVEIKKYLGNDMLYGLHAALLAGLALDAILMSQLPKEERAASVNADSAAVKVLSLSFSITKDTVDITKELVDSALMHFLLQQIAGSATGKSQIDRMMSLEIAMSKFLKKYINEGSIVVKKLESTVSNNDSSASTVN